MSFNEYGGLDFILKYKRTISGNIFCYILCEDQNPRLVCLWGRSAPTAPTESARVDNTASSCRESVLSCRELECHSISITHNVVFSRPHMSLQLLLLKLCPGPQAQPPNHGILRSKCPPFAFCLDARAPY